jgi:cytochrome c oxidase cbb3-type subunit 3/ubiquinol-cytochrome c reductase cytochrome c subunit
MIRAWATIVLLGMVAACSTEEPKPAPNGEALYQQFCAVCHGSEGQGTPGVPDAQALKSPEFLETADETFLANSIIYGRPDTKMSAWSDVRGGPLNEAEVYAIVDHMMSWRVGEFLDLSDVEVTGVAARNGLYKGQCLACHGDAGKGGSGPSLNNSEFLHVASDGFLQYAIQKGRTGTVMPGFEGTLSEEEIDDLVSLIRSWETPVDHKPLQIGEPIDPGLLKPSEFLSNPGGAAPDFDGRFTPADTIAEELEAGKQMLFVDARPFSDYQLDHIENAISIPFHEAEFYVGILPTDVWIVAYCGCPHAESGVVYEILKNAGYSLVTILDEGYLVWKESGYPVSTNVPTSNP